ncbi:hypothetical protein ORV14_01200, partial [Acinetobacter baumannii]
FLILYSSNMYGDEIYLCNKAGFNRKQLKQTMQLAEKNHNSF